MNPPPLSTRWVHAENETHQLGRSSPHQGQHSHVAMHTFVGFLSQLNSLMPLNDLGTAPLLHPHQGISTSWDSEAAFAASMLGYHTCSGGSMTFMLQMIPTLKEHNRHVPLVMMATPWTVGTNVFAYDAGDRDKSTTQRLRKLPENLPKLALKVNSYDFAMEMACTLQARRYNLDEWGAEAILLSVDQCYADAMMHALQRDLLPTWKEVIKMLLRYAPARLTLVEAGRCFGMMRMNIYNLLLCYPQKFEKLHMLSGICHDTREVRTHFLSSLDREVCIMFTGHFPTWLEDSKYDEGYAYLSKLQEMFNIVMRNILRYVKFHQGAYGYCGIVSLVNVRRTEVDDDPMPTENEEAEVDAGADSDWSGEASWPEDGPTARQVDVFGEFRGDDNLDLEVYMALVEPVQ
ncbi:hypothetical protein H4S08_004744 [Coemansia sp. RSA 1365]|nr:hypothetical protein H4S08_004744 [Coemansia sp. RSA 1365]